MTSEYKPCPFCGVVPIFGPLESNTVYFEKCLKCGAEGPSEYDKTKAIEAWNTRPAEAALAAENKQLLYLLKENTDRLTEYDVAFTKLTKENFSATKG